ncbi:hypothetical protein [Aggregatibacter actinomycetemcomitans]|uniref:hypothetical protein n=1 Tax=Aggregatibacter actinomycetemcomitans TaxID=714 RepID=UPI0005D1552B|nr:hypothetical protein [Aggregatibacter actinomycetemcomitans]ACX83518.2 hypothetical protein D11S_2167 [Aggregatibacter actinomycetemcomitans D11S-1]KYK82726.1 hypothetical protein SC936_00645 [Aggregatibacter actinomycetemcomitans serotype e str. SC936]TQE40663.1 hypothetical protein SC1000_09810 [Aggregatibacter actinomycetemcomitans]TYA48892.1 hypothetical protein FXB74_07205 [Aggregatibacter actinomycetemcomitans]TYB11813.1 hypothetical protein FXB84_04155 [Aggregatibacter actinomycetemc
MDNITITMQDMRRVDFCPSGVEAFFLREGLDYADFLQHGIDSDLLLNTGSVFARKCVGAALEAHKGDK